jgi:hypothetical protein
LAQGPTFEDAIAGEHACVITLTVVDLADGDVHIVNLAKEAYSTRAQVQAVTKLTISYCDILPRLLEEMDTMDLDADVHWYCHGKIGHG